LAGQSPTGDLSSCILSPFSFSPIEIGVEGKGKGKGIGKEGKGRVKVNYICYLNSITFTIPSFPSKGVEE